MRASQFLFSVLGFLVFLEPIFAAPSNAEDLLFKKSVELYSKNDFAGSSRVLIRLIRGNPKNALYWFNLGNCYFMAQMYDKAAKSFSKVMVLKSPLSPAAKLYRSKSLAKIGKPSEAKNLLQELLQENPPSGILQDARKDLDAMTVKSPAESQALEAYRQERYADTEKNLVKMGEDISPEGRLLLGLTLAKQNKTSQARGVLKGLVVNSQLSGESQAAARRLLENLREQQNPYWLFLDASYGSADNVSLDGRSSSPLTSAVLRGQVETGYHFHRNHKWSEKLVYAYNNESPTVTPELGTQSHSVLASLLYQGSAVDTALSAYFQNEIWDQSSVSHKSGLSTEMIFEIENTSSVGAEIRAENQTAETATYSYLSGSSYLFRPYYEWGKKYFSLQLQWLLGEDGTQDIWYTGTSRLPSTQNYQGPGLRWEWRPSVRTIFWAYVSRLQRTFKNVSLPANKHRSDTETEISLKFVYAFSPQWRMYSLVEYISNVSSLGPGDVRDKNYNATTSSLGMSWDVF